MDMLPTKNAIKIIGDIMKGPTEVYPNIIEVLKSKHLLIETDDGSYTITSENENELMHSKIGALREAFEKFSNPSDIKNLKNPHVLDLCSGMGYNALSALVCNNDVTIDMLEISQEMIFLGKYIPMPYAEKNILNEAISDFFNDKINRKISIFCDDARNILKRFSRRKYDIVFHDGFSPANDPVLYTVEFLKLVHKNMNDNAILISYSSSIPFRSALIEAGFSIGEGPKIGRNRGLTIAACNIQDYRISNRIPFLDEKLIALSTIGIPYSDPDLKASSDRIIQNRETKRELAQKASNYLSSKKIKKNLIDENYEKFQNESQNSRDAIFKLKKFHKLNG